LEEKIHSGVAIIEDDILRVLEKSEKIINEHIKKKEMLENTELESRGPWGFGPESERIGELPYRVISYERNYEIAT